MFFLVIGEMAGWPKVTAAIFSAEISKKLKGSKKHTLMTLPGLVSYFLQL